MEEITLLIQTFGRAILDYGVFAFGWVAWMYERRRYNMLVAMIVAYFTKVNMLEGFTHDFSEHDSSGGEDSPGGGRRVGRSAGEANRA